MPLTKENLSQLILLQEKDAVLDQLQGEMDKIPAEIAAIKAGVDSQKGRATEAKNAILTLEKRKKEKELDLAQKEEAARKHAAGLNQVKTNEAFKALQNEIDLAKKQGGDIETEILEIMDQLDAAKKEEKSAAAELKGIEDKAKGEISVHEGKLKDIQGRFDAAKGGRDALAAPIPPDAMKVYNHIRSRGKKNAVVAIDGDLCSACRITLAPQVIVEATKARSLVTCESCQRILFRPEKDLAKQA